MDSDGAAGELDQAMSPRSAAALVLVDVASSAGSQPTINTEASAATALT